jgi:histidinol phosphatase-like enzyme
VNPTKILFLDIDGVLNSNRTCVAFDGYPHSFDGRDMGQFDHVAIGLIRQLCKATDCSVVLSSDWRLCSTAHETANALDLPVVDCTPSLKGCRGLEINAWLAAHPEVATYAIVDDNDGMLESQMTRFVKTDAEVGLMLRDYVDLKRILGVVEVEA